MIWEPSIAIRGEVVHPGTYGIRPGEKLSSVLLRAGGFAPAAYPYGAVLLRSEVQKLEQRSYGELVQRVREQQASFETYCDQRHRPGSEAFSGIGFGAVAEHARRPDE